MSRAADRNPAAGADRALARLAAADPDGRGVLGPARIDPVLVAALVAAGLVKRLPAGGLAVAAAGRARLARLAAAKSGDDFDPFLAQHCALARRVADLPAGPAAVVVNEAESPLAWLARRKGKDGRPLIEPAQFEAGERLRADFTYAQLTPRLTVDWASPMAGRAPAGGGHSLTLAETTVAARQRLHRALDAVGPEFAGLLVDVCCFLKGIEEVERARGWPLRSGKVVLQLGLDRLARHYGLGGEARGAAHGAIRTWLAPGERFTTEGEGAPAG